MKIFACLTLLNLLTFSTLVAQGDIDSIQVKKFYKLYEAHLKSYALNDYTTSFNTLLQADSLVSDNKLYEYEHQLCGLRKGYLYSKLGQKEFSINQMLTEATACSKLFCRTKDSRYLKLFNKEIQYLSSNSLLKKVRPEIESIYPILLSCTDSTVKCDDKIDFIYFYIYCMERSGDYDTELKLLDDQLEFCKACYGPTSEDIPYIHYLKSYTYGNLDQMEAAEIALSKGRELWEKVKDMNMPLYYFRILVELSLLYSDPSLLNIVKNRTLQMISLYSKEESKDQTKLYENILYMGLVYKKLNMVDSSLYYFDQYSIIMNTNSSYNTNSFHLWVDYNYAELYLKNKMYDKVLIHASKFYSVKKKSSLPITDLTILTKQAEGLAYLGQKKYEEAVSNFSYNVSISDTLFGKTKYYFMSIYDVGRAQYLQKKYLTSFSNIMEYVNYNREKILDASLFMTEVELEGYMRTFVKSNDYLYSILNNLRTSDICTKVYDNHLFSNNFILNSIQNVRSKKDNDPKVREKYDELLKAQARLSMELAKPPAFKLLVDSLMGLKNEKEKELVSLSRSIASNMHPLNHTDVLNSLRKDEILLEFVSYNYKLDFLEEQSQYGVFILDPVVGEVQFISLFSGSEIDSVTNNAYNFISVNELYDNPKVGHLIWSRLISYLKGKKRIYITTTGILNKLNITALQLNKKQNISDLYEIVCINTSKYLFDRQNVQESEENYSSALVYGNIDYSGSSGSTKGIYATGTLRGLNYYDFYMTDREVRLKKWPDLKYSKAEVERISDKLEANGCKVQVLENKGASEHYLKGNYSATNAKMSPQLMHFSTHAFFLPKSENSMPYDRIYEISYRRMGDFSLIQSGIVLSGANKYWSVTDSTFYDDGILTAFEITQLNLQRTKLVVLSACDTGLGEISNSEGVYGLRRAFKIAGADKILMSLWSVADYQTMEFMDLFYNNLCKNKLAPRKALYNAQKTMRARKYEPYYWAGFVLIE